HKLRWCDVVLAMESRSNYGCAFFEETVVLGVVIVTMSPGYVFLIYKLSTVDDAFKLRREFAGTFIGFFVAIPAYMSVQVLYKTGTLAESRTLHLIM
ncbi:unnamed protein product, partial [Ectocarpus sp. 12 AP-2014]